MTLGTRVRLRNTTILGEVVRTLDHDGQVEGVVIALDGPHVSKARGVIVRRPFYDYVSTAEAAEFYEEVS